MFRTRTLSVSIARPMIEVYDYLAEPRNLSDWTVALGSRFRQLDRNRWIADAPTIETGPITIGFAPRNRFGIIDYDVSYGDIVVSIPARVVANGEGSEVIMTVMAPAEASEEQIASEAEWLLTDLLTLKALLED